MAMFGNVALLPIAERFLELRHDLFHRDITDDCDNRVVRTVIRRVKIREIFAGKLLDRLCRWRNERGRMACHRWLY